jgi:hypothetical protein
MENIPHKKNGAGKIDPAPNPKKRTDQSVRYECMYMDPFLNSPCEVPRALPALQEGDWCAESQRSLQSR